MSKEKKKAVAVIGFDFHLKPKTINTVRDCCKQIVGICKKEKTNNLIIGGDWFTSREAQPLIPLKETADSFYEVKSEGIEILAFPGNHDKTSLDSKHSYLDIFDIGVIQEYSNIIIDGLNIHFIPYFKEKGEYPKYLKEASKEAKKNDGVNVLVTHIAVNGVLNNDGSEVETGIEPNLFKNFDKVLVGHYHDAQKIGDNIFYTGSVYQNNFGENIEDKGVVVLYNDGSIKHCPLDFPKFLNSKVDVSNIKNSQTAIETIVESYEKLEVRGQDRRRVTVTCTDKLKNTLSKELSNKIPRSDYIIKVKSAEESEIKSEGKEIVVYDDEKIKKEFSGFTKELNDTSRAVIKKCNHYLSK